MAEPGAGRELVAELRGRDGRTRTVRVPYPAAEGEAAQLRGLRGALSELQERVAELLAPLVQEERAAAGGARRGAGGDDDDDYDDDEEEEDAGEEENNVDAAASGDDPPVKRTKVQQP
ncbi:RILP-like protein homolog [Passer domesticus]|uniref:RILP-like protein homolog n=1 Tax=Passer domesticus TaxID=48849 RepID=UPI0030FF0C23